MAAKKFYFLHYTRGIYTTHIMRNPRHLEDPDSLCGRHRGFDEPVIESRGDEHRICANCKRLEK